MGDEKERFVLYMCFETDQEHDICRSLVIVSSQAAVEKWKKEKGDGGSTDDESAPDTEESESKSPEEKNEDNPQNPSVKLSKLMSRFQDTMSSYRPLIKFGMFAMPTLRSAFIHNQMYKAADKNLEIIDKDQEFETYGITIDQYPSVRRQIRRLREFDRGVTVLPGAILLSLVATFDSFIGDTLRIMLGHKPERVIESAKTISVKEVLRMASFDDVIGKIIEDEVDAVMRNTHDEQIKYVEDKLDINIRSVYDEWGDFVEIFERRNLIAQGNYIINSHYIKNCNKHGFEVGDDQDGEKLSLDRNYLEGSSDCLLEFGLSLIFVLWLKHFKDSREIAYESLNGRTYGLIKDGQFRVAARLLNLALYKQTPGASDRINKMMTINLANAYKKLKDVEKAQEVIAKVDWSAATDDFQICVAAVQGNIERVVELMPRVARADVIKKSDFREWPVFDGVREEESVREKFQEIYDEPIIDPTDEEDRGDQESTGAVNELDTPTIH